MARRRKGRPLHGVINLYKPTGMSSNGALQRVKYLLQAQKAGHTGALDPQACGVLPLCFGEATKFSQILLDADKEYITTARLGQTTTTADTEGDILEERRLPANLDASVLETYLTRFRGELSQVPSMFSALKHEGQPLYKLARKGKEIDRPARKVIIHELELLELTLPTIRLRVRCSKGTYIRNLVEDLGEALGCGAHVLTLERTQSGPYRLDNAVSLEQLEAAANDNPHWERPFMLPIETSLEECPLIYLDGNQTDSLICGRTVKLRAPEMTGQVRLYRESDQQLLGLAEIQTDGTIKVRRLLSNEFLMVE